MNLLKAVYCNQYYELNPKGKGDAARSNGTRLLAVSLVIDFILLAMLCMVISPDLADAFGDLLQDVFGRRQGRMAGKFVVLIPFLIFLPLVRYTLGTESSYQSTISQFEAQSAEQQKRISKKGLIFVVISMANLFVSLALGLIFFG